MGNGGLLNMAKTIAIMLAALTALLAVPAATTADEAPDREWTVIFTADGHELIPGPYPAGQEECGGEAPAVTQCTTYLHNTNEVWAVAVGSVFTYTGTLEVRLFHSTNVLVFQVHVIEGWPVGFNFYGTFPGSPAIFWHDCFSYELAQAGENPTPLPLQPNGTLGGSGNWDCFVLYP
jgi:hypothetical protein